MKIIGDERNICYENLEIRVSARNDIPVLLDRLPIFEDFRVIIDKQARQIVLIPTRKDRFKIRSEDSADMKTTGE